MGKFKTGLLLSYICIASVSSAIITPALPHIERTFSLNHGALEWVISIFLVGYVIGQLIYGPLANCFGRLSALRSGLLINLFGIVLCIVSVWQLNYGLLLAGRLITALGAAAGLSCTFILLNESLPLAEARHAMSYAIVSFTVGIALSVALGGYITQHLQWQDCFILLFVHGLIMLGLTWQFSETLKKPVSLRPMVILTGYLQAIKNRNLVTFSIAVGLVSTFAYCYSAAAPLYAHSVLHLDPDQYGYWNLINMLGMFSSGFLSAHLIKKFGPLRVLFIAMGLMIPCLISLILIALTDQPNVIWFFMTTMFLYLFTGLLFPTASFFASNAIEDKASGSSMMSFINMQTATIAVVVMGYMPFKVILSFTVTLMLFFITAFLLVLRRVMKNDVRFE